MNSRRLIDALEDRAHIVAAQTRLVKRDPNVRFGSIADICSAKRHVRFTPKSRQNCTSAPSLCIGIFPLVIVGGACSERLQSISRSGATRLVRSRASFGLR